MKTELSTQNVSEMLGCEILSRPVYNTLQKEIVGKKEVVHIDMDGKETSLDIVNQTFSLPSLGRMEELAKNLHKEAGTSQEIKVDWLWSKQIAMFRVPVMEFEITRHNGTKDQQCAYVALKSGFTGKCSRVYSAFFYRLVCSNGLMGLKESRLGAIRNSKFADQREVQLQIDLSHFMIGIKDQVEILQNLAKQVVKESDMQKIIEKAIAKGKKKDELSSQAIRQIDDIIARVKEGTGNDGATLYDIINGATHFATHDAGRAKSRFESNMAGSNQMLANSIAQSVYNFASLEMVA